MKQTHHTEYLKLKTVYLKPVSNAFISDSALTEQWKSLNYLDKPDYRSSLNEYKIFEEVLKQEHIDLKYFPQDPTTSIDSIYCRDASIATDFGMIICNMGKEGRKEEPMLQEQEYSKNDISILGKIESPGTLEGGDVTWLDDNTLAVGHTYRTNLDGIRQLKHMLEPNGVEVIVVPLPHYKGPSDVFHLMSILSPVAKDLAVVYSPLMPVSFKDELINRGFSFIEVPDEEFDSMGCNVLAIAPGKCIMVDGNPITKKAMIDANCEVVTYKGDEISIKGGGGPTCLTRPLLRTY